MEENVMRTADIQLYLRRRLMILDISNFYNLPNLFSFDIQLVCQPSTVYGTEYKNRCLTVCHNGNV